MVKKQLLFWASKIASRLAVLVKGIDTYPAGSSFGKKHTIGQRRPVIALPLARKCQKPKPTTNTNKTDPPAHICLNISSTFELEYST
jgi:hypothetical protein